MSVNAWRSWRTQSPNVRSASWHWPEPRRERRPRWPTSPRYWTACRILASSLDAAPQGELRALFDSLQLDVVCQPADSAVDVAATLYDLGNETAQSAAPRSAEDWYAHPASHNANLGPLVEGPALTLAGRHTKVRREGYPK